jgi:hypothetical protein
MGISETGNFTGERSPAEEIAGVIQDLRSEVQDAGDTVYSIGVGLGCYAPGDDVVPVSPGILTSIAGSLERIAVSLDILAGVADHRVRRIP